MLLGVTTCPGRPNPQPWFSCLLVGTPPAAVISALITVTQAVAHLAALALPASEHLLYYLSAQTHCGAIFFCLRAFASKVLLPLTSLPPPGLPCLLTYTLSAAELFLICEARTNVPVSQSVPSKIVTRLKVTGTKQALSKPQ